MEIYHIALIRLAGAEAEIEVGCSKGTYIRTLAEDIGKALGCGAYLTQLRRTASGMFDLNQAVTADALEGMTMEQRDACLLQADVLLQHLPAVTLDADSAYYLCQGQPVWKSGVLHRGHLRLYAESGRFLGLGEVADDGKIAPRRLVVDKKDA